MNSKIPTDEHGFIDYGEDGVFIIELDSRPDATSGAYFQYDGNLCKSRFVCARSVMSFKSKFKWFSPNFWALLSYGANGIRTPKMSKKIKSAFISHDQIIEAIKKEVERVTGWSEIEIEGDWYEAYVRFKHDDKTYLLTWENSD